MVNVTIWYEYTQESGYLRRDLVGPDISEEDYKNYSNYTVEVSKQIHEVYPDGLMAPVINALKGLDGYNVTYTTLYDDQFGLSDELLNNTDVLVWWSHINQDAVPDELSHKITDRILKGMGFVVLHSAHKSKPFMEILGTSGSLKWREGDFCRIWNTCPTHPIAAGISESIELEEEEMYGEYFDIPKPDDVVFTSWFRGGEIFRSGCTWTRGYGKIFYFQPGHETSPSYNNPEILKIICNGVRWATPSIWRDNLECPNIIESPESKHKIK